MTWTVTPTADRQVAERVRRIGLAGEALVQLRADYSRKPSNPVIEAIRLKVAELAALAETLTQGAQGSPKVSEGDSLWRATTNGKGGPEDE